MLVSILVFTTLAAGLTLEPTMLPSIVFLALILGAGSGGVPASGLVVAMTLVQAFDLPVEIAAIVGGIYRLVDVGNTTVNCMGDMVGTLIVARWKDPT